jgi:hypothetical protein
VKSFSDKKTLWAAFYIQNNWLSYQFLPFYWTYTHQREAWPIFLEYFLICTRYIMFVGQSIGLQNFAFEGLWPERGTIIWTELFARVLSKRNVWLFCCEFSVRKRLDKTSNKNHSKIFIRVRAPGGFRVRFVWFEVLHSTDGYSTVGSCLLLISYRRVGRAFCLHIHWNWRKVLSNHHGIITRSLVFNWYFFAVLQQSDSPLTRGQLTEESEE